VIVIGYISAVVGLYFLYANVIALGAFLLFIGGILSGGFTIGLSSISILSFISFIAYAIHNEFTPTVIILCLISAVTAVTSKGRGFWELDLGLIDFGSGDWGNSD